MLQDGHSQLFPPSDRDERMLRAKNDCEVRFELTGQIGDDVHLRPDGMS